MASENVPTVLAEHVHKGLFHRDLDHTSSSLPAFRPQARLKECLRIARRFHGALSQGFLSASLQFCFVDVWLPADSPTMAILRRALNLLRKRIDAKRGALSGPRSPALPDGSLEKALSNVRDELAPGDQPRLRIVILGETRPLAPAVYDQIYWIAREALMNAFRHSSARRVEAEIEYLPRKLRVVIRDDGTGIDPEALRTRPNRNSSLTIMHEKAASVGAKVRARSKQGEGTEVELLLPIPGNTA